MYMNRHETKVLTGSEVAPSVDGFSPVDAEPPHPDREQEVDWNQSFADLTGVLSQP